MALICTARHDATKFIGWPNPGIEVSDLTGPFMSRIYDDAYDMGFRLLNPETGNETIWYMATEVRNGRDGDGELSGWKFRPTPETAREFPGTVGCEIFVFND